MRPEQKDPRPRRRSRSGLALAGVLVLALLVRGAYLFTEADKPAFTHPEVDAAYHDYWARGLVSGIWTPPPGQPDPEIATRAYFRPPGYPFFLAAVYRVLGTDYLVPRLVQAALGVLNAWLAFLLARRWFGAPAGVLAAAFLALHAGLVYFEAELLEPVLLVTLSLLTVLALGAGLGGRARLRALAAGLLLGLYALVRPNGLLFAPAVVGWLFWLARRAKTPRAWRAPALAFVLGLGAAIFPAALRNVVTAGDAVAISSNAGINLYIGNHPQATGVVTFYLPGLGVFGTSFDYPAIARAVEARVGRPLKDSGVSRYFTREALKFIRQQPGAFLRLLGRKALLFWGPVELGHNKEDYYERKFSPVLRWLPNSFPLLLALGGVGLILWRRRAAPPDTFAALVLMLLYVGAIFFSHLPFFVAGRYRLPVVPFLLILGAAGVARLAQLWREGRRGPAARAAAAGAAIYVLAAINYTGYRPNLAKWYYEQFIASSRAGRAEEAQAWFKKTAAEDPGFLHALYHNLGMGLADQQQFEAARGMLQEALVYKPGAPDTLSSLGAVLFSLGRTEEALSHFAEALRVSPGHREARVNLAFIQAEQGRLDEAIAQYRDLLAAGPDDPRVLRQFAVTLEKAGRREEAAEQLVRAVRLDPGDPQAHSSLGALLAELNRPAEALRELEEAARLDPELWESWFGAGVILARQGVWADSIEMMNKAARLRPDDAQPLFYIAGALARLNRLDESLAHYQESLRLYSNYVPWLAEAAWTLATHPMARAPAVDEALRFAEEAARLTGYRDAQVLDALAAALARGGDYTQAAARAEAAALLAEEAGRTNLASDLRSRLVIYKDGKPYME
ncbi:MAG: tetratricopeptide repeat protein [Kiritimatiellae bacterium]|nr:tetratricopeptide repeat protein [Kiritimatiellia bacterium]